MATTITTRKNTKGIAPEGLETSFNDPKWQLMTQRNIEKLFRAVSEILKSFGISTDEISGNSNSGGGNNQTVINNNIVNNGDVTNNGNTVIGGTIRFINPQSVNPFYLPHVGEIEEYAPYTLYGERHESTAGHRKFYNALTATCYENFPTVIDSGWGDISTRYTEVTGKRVDWLHVGDKRSAVVPTYDGDFGHLIMLNGMRCDGTYSNVSYGSGNRYSWNMPGVILPFQCFLGSTVTESEDQHAQSEYRGYHDRLSIGDSPYEGTEVAAPLFRLIGRGRWPIYSTTPEFHKDRYSARLNYPYDGRAWDYTYTESEVLAGMYWGSEIPEQGLSSSYGPNKYNQYTATILGSGYSDAVVSSPFWSFEHIGLVFECAKGDSWEFGMGIMGGVTGLCLGYNYHSIGGSAATVTRCVEKVGDFTTPIGDGEPDAHGVISALAMNTFYDETFASVDHESHGSVWFSPNTSCWVVDHRTTRIDCLNDGDGDPMDENDTIGPIDGTAGSMGRRLLKGFQWVHFGVDKGTGVGRNGHLLESGNQIHFGEWDVGQDANQDPAATLEHQIFPVDHISTNAARTWINCPADGFSGGYYKDCGLYVGNGRANWSGQEVGVSLSTTASFAVTKIRSPQARLPQVDVLQNQSFTNTFSVEKLMQGDTNLPGAAFYAAMTSENASSTNWTGRLAYFIDSSDRNHSTNALVEIDRSPASGGGYATTGILKITSGASSLTAASLVSINNYGDESATSAFIQGTNYKASSSLRFYIFEHSGTPDALTYELSRQKVSSYPIFETWWESRLSTGKGYIGICNGLYLFRGADNRLRWDTTKPDADTDGYGVADSPKTFNQASAPTGSDIPSGNTAIWIDSGTSQCYYCFNHGGTVKTVEMT